MNVKHSAVVLFLTLLPAFFSAEHPSLPQIPGIWQNSSRFIEFSADSRMRAVLKSYYGFVYENTPWIPCAVSSPVATVNDQFLLTIRYAGEKKDSVVPVALMGDSLFFSFYQKNNPTPATVGAPFALDGFYRSLGNAPSLRLYRMEMVSEFYCYYFTGNTYYRIRYWTTDARFKDLSAHFTTATGEVLTVPKFISFDSVLYTCITSTGSVLRNYEVGTFSLSDGFITFKPSNIVFSGTAASVLKPLRLTVSSDGNLLALGEPYLVRSKITDLDGEIQSHNALRRPLRKPVFGFMDLNFYWDEIDRIRNGNSLN